MRINSTGHKKSQLEQNHPYRRFFLEKFKESKVNHFQQFWLVSELKIEITRPPKTFDLARFLPSFT